jgi:hypothetical protein
MVMEVNIQVLTGIDVLRVLGLIETSHEAFCIRMRFISARFMPGSKRAGFANVVVKI